VATAAVKATVKSKYFRLESIERKYFNSIFKIRVSFLSLFEKSERQKAVCFGVSSFSKRNAASFGIG
jgi:hypothetical protein